MKKKYIYYYEDVNHNVIRVKVSDLSVSRMFSDGRNQTTMHNAEDWARMSEHSALVNNFSVYRISEKVARKFIKSGVVPVKSKFKYNRFP